MTVPSTYSPNVSTANGVTTVFPFGFLILAAEHLVVELDGVPLTYPADYSVSGVGNPSGGNATLNVAPASQVQVVRRRETTLERQTDYQNLGDLLSDTLNADQDYPIVALQEVKEKQSRALTVPIGTLASAELTTNPLDYGRYLRLRLDGAGFEFVDGTGTSPGEFTQDGVGAIDRTIQSKLAETVSILDFGGVGNDTVDNEAVFAAIEFGSAERIYLPQGTYYTSGPANSLTKHYYGPGKIRTLGGDNTPGRFTWMTDRPDAGTGSSYAKFFSADLSSVDAAYQICAADRTGLTEAYFAPETSMRLSVFDNRSGYSGTTARLTAEAALGATSATINSADGLSIGSVIGFNDGNDGITNIRTLTNVAGNVISWADPLIAPAPYAIGSRVTLGTRTMQSLHHLELQHRGGGDGYIHLMRVEASYEGTDGQDHTFFRSTAGLDGGDVVASTDNVYLTGREITFDDNGFDIEVISEIRTFNRTNAAAALDQAWHGQTMNSSGEESCEVAYIAAGKWKALFDSSRMDASENAGCVGNMADDQYWYWGSQGDPAQIYESWGRIRGTKKFGYSSGRAAFALDGAPISGDTLHVAPGTVADPTVGYVASGVYTPTLTNTTNVAASTAFECMWTRVGKVVTVSGQVNIDPTAGSTLTQLGISLPIASAFSAGRQLAGVCATDEIVSASGRVTADATNDRANLAFIATADVAARTWGFTFQYLVL